MSPSSLQPQKTVLLTGGNGGIGLQCARYILQSGGWQVVIAARPGEKTANALKTLQQEATGDSRVVTLPVDLASLQSVRDLAAQVARLDAPPLHAIVCNAGVETFSKLTYSHDGFEMTFAVNHLAHFLLIQLLLPHLQGHGAGTLLALVSTFAGNLLLVGSIANLIVVDLARKAGVQIGWRQHAAIGMPVTLLSLAVLWFWWR